MKESPGDVTLLLVELKLGHKDALNRLIPLVYGELRRLAAHYLRAERIGHTLQPTAVVHEAYLRLVGQDRADWQNRAQFMRVAGQLMRRILVDYARARTAEKREGNAVRLELTGFDIPDGAPQNDEVLAVDQALARLSELDAQAGSIVELRYFAGLTVQDTAEALGISSRTVKRDWAMASAWLNRELKQEICRKAPA